MYCPLRVVHTSAKVAQQRERHVQSLENVASGVVDLTLEVASSGADVVVGLHAAGTVTSTALVVGDLHELQREDRGSATSAKRKLVEQAYAVLSSSADDVLVAGRLLESDGLRNEARVSFVAV